MFCDEVLELVEPIAAGDLTPEGRVAAHLTTCANCRAALDRAREIERVLQTRPAPQAPSQFTSRTLARIRRDRWRSDQLLDTGFNAVVILLVLAAVAGAWLVMNRSGLITISSDAMDLVETGVATMVQRIAPAVPLYAAAAALLAGAVGIWWWAERDLTL